MPKYNYYSNIMPETEDKFIAISAILKSRHLGQVKSWGYEIIAADFTLSIYERSSTINIASVNSSIVIDNDIIFSHLIKEFYTA